MRAYGRVRGETSNFSFQGAEQRAEQRTLLTSWTSVFNPLRARQVVVSLFLPRVSRHLISLLNLKSHSTKKIMAFDPQA
jgi:hypothetical protein